MTSGFYGPEDRSPFDDFLARLYGTAARARPPGGSTSPG